MNRQQKLNTLEKRQSEKKVPVVADGKPFLDALESKVKELTKSLDIGVDLNADELIEKLQEVGSLADELNELKKSLEDFTFPKLPSSVKLEGIEPLIQYLRTLPRKEIDLSPINKITKSLDNLIQKVEAIKVPKQGQKPDDFIPMRRVVKMGNRLLYDDSFYTGGGGGSSVPTVNGSVPVVNPDGSTISGGGGGGDATAANQIAGNASLAAIQVDTDYRFSGGKSAYVSTISSSGNHDAITPASGNRIRVFWIGIVPNSDNSAANLVKLGFGTTGGSISTELYRLYAMAHWEVFTGTANQSVIINTGTVESIAVSIHYQEIA